MAIEESSFACGAVFQALCLGLGGSLMFISWARFIACARMVVLTFSVRLESLRGLKFMLTVGCMLLISVSIFFKLVGWMSFWVRM